MGERGGQDATGGAEKRAPRVGVGRKRGTVAASTPAPPLDADLAALLDEYPKRELCYVMHLRGYSYRAIGARLGLDKDTANKWSNEVAREYAPQLREDIKALRRAGVKRLRAVQFAAWEAYESAPDPGWLNVIRGAEEQMARLWGLHQDAVEHQHSGGVGIAVEYINDWRGKGMQQGTSGTEAVAGVTGGGTRGQDDDGQDAEDGE